ncbi:MAG: rubrerythrin family protein [Chitinispirillaceae bacterium]|nr:rubrerythrin family protein [Chitinispirillaceae bacterium]
MPSIKGTKTEQNLLKAFAGESQARNRYSFAASVAKKEGYEQIAAIFLETADNEKQHAKRFFRFLEGGMLEITAAYPAGVIGTTIENLKAAADGEHEEHSILYPEFARIAQEEGFPQVATQFNTTLKVEKHHEERYRMLLKNLEEKTTFKKKQSVKWICRECGYVHEGPEAPVSCPCCEHPQAFFQVLCDNY